MWVDCFSGQTMGAMRVVCVVVGASSIVFVGFGCFWGVWFENIEKWDPWEGYQEMWHLLELEFRPKILIVWIVVFYSKDEMVGPLSLAHIVFF